MGRRMYSPGWQGDPTAGCTPAGRVPFGRVQALPIRIYLNYRRYNFVPNRRVTAPRTVIVYNHPGAWVATPRGWYAASVGSAFGRLIVPASGTPQALALHEPGT